MEEIVIKKANQQDFAQIRSFYDYVIDETTGMDQYAKWKKEFHPQNDTIRGYIADEDMYMCFQSDELIGVMALAFYQDEEYQEIEWKENAGKDEIATLHIFAVSPKLQGKGYGKKLLNLAIDMAREKGTKVFRLDSLSSNIPSIHLYESVGFQLRGKQNLYTDNAGFVDFCYFEKGLFDFNKSLC